MGDWESFWDVPSPQEEADRRADYDYWVEVAESVKGRSSGEGSSSVDRSLFEAVVWMRATFGGAAHCKAIEFAKAAVQQGKNAEHDFWLGAAKLLVSEYLVPDDG